MITYEQLYAQSDKITQLSRILRHLIDDRAILDMEETCDIFYKYMEAVKTHIDTVDGNLYASLLSSNDVTKNNMAKNFMSGSQEIRRILKSYHKAWCNKNKGSIRVSNHDKFVNDTRELFDIVLTRITREVEELYPSIREVRNDLKVAA